MIQHWIMIKKAFLLHFEWVALLAMLLLATTLDPTSSGPSYCLLKQLGSELCPGCGLGRSMALAAQGSYQASIQMQPMGIIAIPVLLFSIIQLLTRNYHVKPEHLVCI